LSLSPAERQSISSMGGRALVAKGLTNTVAARQAFRDRFLDQVDPERILPEKERAKRAEAARLLWYEGLRYKRLKAQRQKREAKKSP
jgi:hypothetical protein